MAAVGTPSNAAASSSSGSTMTTTRLHVSGLNPTQCTLDDIKARFRSFGLSVSDVHNWPPKQNAVDKTTNWCFVTVTGGENAVNRLMGMLNGTMWKGAKLQIGYAKRRQWQQAAEGATDKEVEKERKKDERKAMAAKRQRGIVGRESDDITTPVTVASVEEKEPWGWNKTRGGHLVRPMHMRPEHPLPQPAITQTEESSEATKDRSSNGRKRRRSKTAPVKLLSRAKRITIDPTRYGAAHISGTMMLEDGSIRPAPTGFEWRCKESADSTSAVWTLFDANGDSVKQEKVQLRPVSDSAGHVSESEESFDDDDDDAQEDDDVLAEINAAIDNATEEEPDYDPDISENAEKESLIERGKTILDSADHAVPVFLHYDPEEDDVFSDGYQEVAGVADEPASKALDWAGEKSGQLDLLKSMFGEKVLDLGDPVQQVVPLSPPTEEDDDDDIEFDATTDVAPEETSATPTKVAVAWEPTPPATEGMSRRAALLQALQPFSATKQSQFQPIVRFDPATANGKDVTQDDDDADPQVNALKANDQGSHTPTERAEDRVEMDKLTDMFRPKEDSKVGFSLMADLDLDLDDDLNFEPELEDDDDGGVPEPWSLGQRNMAQRDQQDVGPASATATKAPFVVPRYDATGAMRITDGRDVFAVLLQEQREAAATDALEASFYRVDDEATLTRKWDERKVELTQVFKRRHREALKKKKRKFTGSRAAGTALPGRRVA